MKKIYNILLSFVFAGCLLGSCDYLDIVPNETANEEDAFASEQAALNYLYSCYSFMLLIRTRILLSDMQEMK